MHIPTIKVKPWGKDQGDFVEINAADFDPKAHSLLAGEVMPEPIAEPAADEAPLPNPLDHDGRDGAGGSVKGYHATAAKGARRKAKAKGKK